MTPLLPYFLLAQVPEAPDADSLAQSLADTAVNDLVRAAVLIVVAVPLVYLLTRLVGRFTRKRFSPQASFLARKATLYLGVILVFFSVLGTLNINLTAILGAAGVGALAVGFAAQTALSNLISGIFLIIEKPFAVGDTIRVGSTLGTVQSIDLLSVKLNTPDNLFVRIPNENLVKSECTTISRNANRRLDIAVGVAYESDINRALAVLAQTVAACPLALKDPAPLITATDFGDSSVNLLVGAWCKREDYFTLRNALIPAIKDAFDKAGIEIPYPHLSLYTGEATKPFPVKLERD